jgi:hypothetical protein
VSLTTRRSPRGKGELIAGTTVSEPVTSIESRKTFMNFFMIRNEKKPASLGFSGIANLPQEVDAQWHALVQQWTPVIDKANIKVE